MADEQDGARRGRPPLGEQGRRRQRLEISRQAVRLFRAHGVPGTSGAEIARASGVSERTLWRLFRTKESCVEPLLTEALDSFRAVLRSWPPDLELAEHLRAAYDFAPESTPADRDAVLAVVRMSRTDRALRAVWLVLQEGTEPTIAEVLADRTGQPADTPELRVMAATVNAALRVATDDLAWAAADGVTVHGIDGHRLRLAEVLHAATAAPQPDPAG